MGMEIAVEGVGCTLDPLPDTIGLVIDVLKSNAARQGRVVLSVRIDGADTNMAGQQQLADRPSEDFSQIEMVTADAKELCVATLEESARHIPPVVEEAERVSDLIDAGEETKALQRLAPLLEVWSTLVAAVEKVSFLLELDLNEVADDGVSLADVIHELSVFLQHLKAGIDSRDLVSVRDSMKHEMPAIAEKLNGQLTALCSAVSAS